MAALRTYKRFQFSLRSLLLALLLTSICAANWFSLMEVLVGAFYRSIAVVAFITWWAGQRIRSGAAELPRFSGRRVLLPFTFFAFSFSLWIRHRWVVCFRDAGWPRAFPYPDEIMLVFHDWLDSLYPVEHGSIKIHGEFYTVLAYLNLIAFCLCTVFGAMLGLTCKTSGPFGLTFWRDRIVRAYRRLNCVPPASWTDAEVLIWKTSRLYRGMGWTVLAYLLFNIVGMLISLSEGLPPLWQSLGALVALGLVGTLAAFMLATANHLNDSFEQTYGRARWIGIIVAALFFPFLTVPGILAVRRLEFYRELRESGAEKMPLVDTDIYRLSAQKAK